MTIAVGQTASNGVNLGSEKLVGFLVRSAGGGGGTDFRLQTLISGNLGDAASEVWADVRIKDLADNTSPFGSSIFAIDNATPLTTGIFIEFPRDAFGYPTPVIRLVAQAAASGTPWIFSPITDPHQ
jgi:hypothetical protein